MIGLKEYRIETYEEAVKVINEVGILPLAALVPQYPSLDSITDKENWYTGSELDPWSWRVRFPVDGVAAYGKFIKKKSIFISRELLPVVGTILGSEDTLEKRYSDGLVSREALELFQFIQAEEGIDTRVLRVKAGMKDKEKKKVFDQALLELQGSMDIVICGTKEKTNELGEKNGWSSTSYETMENWANRHKVQLGNIKLEDAKITLKNHLEKISGQETMKSFSKIFRF